MSGVDIKIKELKSKTNNHIINLLDEYMREKNFSNYDSALDNFAFKFGISMIHLPFLDKKYKLIGYFPKIIYHPDNAFNKEAVEKKIYSNETYTLKESEKLLTKYVIYKLMELRNPEQYLKNDSLTLSHSITKIKIMNDILSKAQKIIEQAETNKEFHSEYANNLVGTGERSSDYSSYHFEINDDYYLIIDFADFSFENFSLVYQNHHHQISLNGKGL